MRDAIFASRFADLLDKIHGVWSLKYALTAEQQEIMNVLGVKKTDL